MNIKGLLLGALLLAGCLSVHAYQDHRHAEVDSAEQVLQSGRPLSDKERMTCYYILVRGYLRKDTEKHDRYCRQLLELSGKAGALNMRESALYHLGLQHYGREEYDKAERYFLWALAVTDSMRSDKRYTESDIDDNFSQLYGALGNLYNIQDKALLAIDYYQKALPIFQRHGWLESQTILHHNVAELWLSMDNTEKALQEYQLAIETGMATGDSLMVALPRKGLVKIYLGEGDYEKIRGTLLPAYEYYHAHQDEDPDDYAEVLASMTKMYLMDGHEDLGKAKAYVREALSRDNGELMAETRCDIYAAATMVAIREGHWPQALEYALQSVHENDDEATYSDVGCYELLAVIYMNLGDKPKARLYISKMRDMMARFSTRHYQSGLSQMEVIYETEKKENTIRQLETERRWFLWGGILVALLLLLTALIFFLLWRSNRLSKESAVFKARLDGEVAERSRIARDLHDGLGGMLSLLRLKVDGEVSKTEALQLLDATHRELRLVAHNLMPEQLLTGGLSSALSDFAQSVPNARFHHFGCDRRLPRDIEVVLYRCAYELVNNALKHARATEIDIQLVQDTDKVTLTVCDDGCGIDDARLPVSDGIGLRNIRERISHYGGVLDILANEGKGSEINVTLPL
ncbi:MAG: hypothetical protein IJ762_08855 [Bacteroidaceae bacterium]|nr:hypothetical protein [Bacteroidaceae bacterium]MBR1789278.1 hypothetical protein [Bacteroidaceae bacterium]